jgi:hypothetical protein
MRRRVGTGYLRLKRVCYVVDGGYTKGRAVASSSGDADSLAPSGKGRRPQVTMRAGADEMAAGIEGVIDGGVSGQVAAG